mmetsp:Transcript_3951/g.9671  ORF Transcript_3951/g.9671 Transcript_3951/m.9671 type:complete len:722 (+) Transcript_3951:44-2209(+)
MFCLRLGLVSRRSNIYASPLLSAFSIRATTTSLVRRSVITSLYPPLSLFSTWSGSADMADSTSQVPPPTQGTSSSFGDHRENPRSDHRTSRRRGGGGGGRGGSRTRSGERRWGKSQRGGGGGGGGRDRSSSSRDGGDGGASAPTAEQIEALVELAQREADEAEVASVLATVGGRVPKRNLALLISYSGTGFHGMQKQGTAELAERFPTIELALEKALYAAGGILESNYGDLQRVAWQRCARTDKGVHALGQVVGAKLLLAPGLLPRTNAHLPPGIRVQALQRVPNSFNARTACDARTYVYALPTIVLANGYADSDAGRYHQIEERTHLADAVRSCRERLADAQRLARPASPPRASAGRGRGTGANSMPLESSHLSSAADSSSTSSSSTVEATTSSAGDSSLSVTSASSPTSSPSSAIDHIQAELQAAVEAEQAFETQVLGRGHTAKDEQLLATYRIDEATRERLLQTLCGFVGSHNFWNYTSGKQPDDSSARRFVHWWEVSEPFQVDGVEFVNLRVRGQSFILHQIRKMVCMAVDLMREGGSAEVLEASFCSGLKLTLDLAPGECLMLRHCHFDQYCARPELANRPPLTFAEVQADIEHFQRSVVLPEIAGLIKEGLFADWLRRHRYYHYPLEFEQWVESTRDEIEENRARLLRRLERKEAAAAAAAAAAEATEAAAEQHTDESCTLGKRLSESELASTSKRAATIENTQIREGVMDTTAN